MESENTPTNPLLSFPLELWYHIVDLQPDPGELCRPLTLVCHSFRNFFQPLLFRTILIQILPGRHSLIEKQIAFLNTERILPAVRRCRVQHPWLGSASSHLTILGHAGFHPIFPQLEFISLSGLDFGDSDLPILARLQNVREVKLRECGLLACGPSSSAAGPCTC